MNPHECLRLAAAGLCASALLGSASFSAAEAEPPAEVQAPKIKKSRVSPQFSAAVNSREAERRLEQAQMKRNLGAMPLPGESARVSGGIAVNARYWNRQ